MNLKPFIPLAVALLLGLVAAKIAYDVSHKKAVGLPTSHGVQVVVARGQIAPGSELTSDQLMLASIAGDATPAKAFLTTSDVVGRVVTTPLFEGQPVLQDFLAPKGTAAGLTSLIPTGMRAMTIDVNDTSGMSGMLAPGCHVDVVSTIGGAAEGEKPITRVICQNILITAVGQRLSPTKPEGDKDPGYHTVTLIATLREAELIELANTAARTRLILRAHDDTQLVDSSDGVTQVELRGQARPHMAALAMNAADTNVIPVSTATTSPSSASLSPDMPAPRPVWRMEVIRGGQSTYVDFDLPKEPVAAAAAATMPAMPETMPATLSDEPLLTDTDQRPAVQQ